MDKIEKYKENIRNVIKRHANIPAALNPSEIETFTIFDETHQHYQLMRSGWNKSNRQYGIVIHISVKNDKIWIEYDGTEYGIANELVDLGIPKSEIVLGYFTPFARRYSEFAVT